MISTNINLLQRTVSEFIKLDTGDKLGLLLLLYQHFSNSIPIEKLEVIAQYSIYSIVPQIQLNKLIISPLNIPLKIKLNRY